jgi:hippurate hydrolase
MPIVNRIADFHAEITAWRRDIHAHPELQYDVHRTAGAVADKLKNFGCDEVVTGIGRTGVVGVIRGSKAGEDGRVIGLRADMDALPIEEATDVPYKWRRSRRRRDQRVARIRPGWCGSPAALRPRRSWEKR